MRKGYRLTGAMIFAALAALILCVSSAQAQFKYLPTLTLQKIFPVGPNDVSSDDTLFVAEPGNGEKRFFLLPVYFKNVLDSIYNPITGLSGEPLYSFRFKIQYNRSIMRAIGVQKRGDAPTDTYVGAKNFNLSWDVKQDSLYKTLTVGAPSANGERIMITGASSIPLPLPKRADAPAPPIGNQPQFRDTAVLLYVLFEIVGSSTGPGAVRDQVTITNDSIMWNDYTTSYPVFDPDINAYSPSRVSPEMIARGFNPNPGTQQGIAPSPIFPVTYPPPGGNAYSYGSVIVEITAQPRINLLPVGDVIPVPGDPASFELVNVIQTQYGNNNFVFRNLLIQNAQPGTVLRNVTIETDQPWLRVDNLPADQAGQNGGGGTPPGERGVFIREIPGSQLDFNIIANPSMLPTVDGSGYPTPGIYIGYVTIRSTEARNSAVRLKVVLIVNRNPLETGLVDSTESVNTRGIRLLFRNSAPNADTTYLTFGTGTGATDSIDRLFGEAEADAAASPTSFFARFFPPGFDSINGRPFNGLVDTRGLPPGSTNGEQSMDIRNFKVNTTLTYCVRFGAAGPQNYPIVIEYNTADFPNGSQIFLRDAVNGQIFSQNLRNSTSLGGTIRSFTIRDPNITSFCIEYTLPSVVQFPEIRRGWNFVSLPVNPSDARSGVVFPNIASGKPIFFTQNQYFPTDTVRVGIGYFVKYGSNLDRTVAGTQVFRIHEIQTPYRIRVYEGWNTIGGLSVPTSTDNQYLNFGPIPGSGNPVRVGEVYRYITDRGYEQASLIIPGYGYWVKIDRDGFLRLSAPAGAIPPKAGVTGESYKVLSRLTVSDNEQKVGTLYFGQSSASINNSQFELPPTPAGDMFDVRFDNGAFVSASKDVAAERIVKIQGVEYPVVLSVNRADADYVVTDAETGRVLGNFNSGENGNVTITDPSVKFVKLVGAASSEMNLGEAYPNPAVAKLNFSFNVPAEQKVTIALYSPLGGEVARLFDGRANGQQSVEFSTDGLPSGVYYYKMTTASGFSQVRQVVISK